MNPLDRMLAATPHRSPGSPLLTYYDETTGERVELSWITTDNWVSKTANLLAEEFGVRVGQRVAVDLPPHWQTVVLWMAVWRIGAGVRQPGTTARRAGTAGTDDGNTSVTVTDEGRLDAYSGGDEVLALSLAPLGRGLTRTMPGVLDYAAEVAAYGDDCPAVDPGGDEVAFESTEGDRLSYSEFDDLLRAKARRQGLGPQDRVLATFDDRDRSADPRELLVPVMAGASLILVGNAEEAVAQRHSLAEKVTRTMTQTDVSPESAGP